MFEWLPLWAYEPIIVRRSRRSNSYLRCGANELRSGITLALPFFSFGASDEPQQDAVHLKGKSVEFEVQSISRSSFHKLISSARSTRTGLMDYLLTQQALGKEIGLICLNICRKLSSPLHSLCRMFQARSLLELQSPCRYRRVKL